MKEKTLSTTTQGGIQVPFLSIEESEENAHLTNAELERKVWLLMEQSFKLRAEVTKQLQDTDRGMQETDRKIQETDKLVKENAKRLQVIEEDLQRQSCEYRSAS